MVKKSTVYGFITFTVCLLVLMAVNYYVINTVFCDTCEFHDQNMIYKALYRTEAGFGYYYTEPTLLNYITLGLLSTAMGRLVARK